MAKKPLLPPAYFQICLLAIVAVHFLLPLARLVSWPYRLLGILPLGLGLALNLWADAWFKKRNTTVKPFETPSAFLREGPFRFSRHPMYLGMVLALLGGGLLSGSLSALLVPVFFGLLMQLRFIPHEEQAMAAAFGQSYLEYQKRVRAWL